ncbi:uncharacterized protein EAE97_007455 [Botrytis byssoidea]|uniref:Uncharacterized protein n=1 Tax=Botrytis byssoidea TaxID=139641 RepID=A0A9P5IKF3_9HELO|nr:uncharacterized protein EAE97_007455 [Botrytis byssoidea]KAF7939375.1 hypothetical protein EAE97_007455 [Botrytis byssoidea]
MASKYAVAGERYTGGNSEPTDSDDDDAMARTAANIEDELGDEDEDPNPGDEVLWLGKYKGHKYDELSFSYIEWMIKKYLENPDTAWPNIKDFKSLYDRKQVWIEKNSSELPPPGKTIMWFGQHKGIAFDKLEDGYLMSLVNFYYRDGDKAIPNIRKFKELKDTYDSRLILKKMRTSKSPGSIPIWFGEDKGREFRKIYDSQPRQWRKRLKICRWAPILKAIAREYEECKLSRPPRKQAASRNKPVIVNPVGERLGPADDGVASDDESYISDGGFVVQDEDESSDADESSDEDETRELDYDEEFEETEEVDESTTTVDCEVNKNTSPDLDSSESDTSEEVLPGTPSVSRSSKRKPLEISDDFASLSDSGEESEAIVSPTKRRMTRSLFSPRKRVVLLLESDSDD